MRALALTRMGVGSLVAAGVMVVAAAALSLPALLYVTFLLLGLVLFGLLHVLLGQARVRVERAFAPQIVQLGGPTTARVRVTNASILPCLDATWSDTLPSAVTGVAEGLLPPLGSRLSPRSRVAFDYRLEGNRRGWHMVGPLVVEVADPFGLILRRHVLGEPDGLVVLPRVVDLSSVDARIGDTGGSTLPAPQHAGRGDDDVIARPYLPGDAMKRLHWKATARTGQLMVRQEEQHVNPRATVLIDVSPRSHGTEVDRQGEWEYSPSLEATIVAAASITTELVRTGHVVTVRSGDGSVDRVVADGHDTVQDVLIDLATLEPSEDLTTPETDGAVFVLAGALGTAAAQEWAARVRAPARALLDAATPHGAVAILEAAGWRCVTHRARDELAGPWSELVAVNHAAG